MFVGLQGPAKDNERFAKLETRVLFIQRKEGEWQYYGHYDVFRDPNDDLTVAEWSTLTEEVGCQITIPYITYTHILCILQFRSGYAACTLSKRMGNAKCDDFRKQEPSRYKAEVEKITADYDAGKLRVPCVILKCVKFDEELVASLSRGSASPRTNSKRKFEDLQTVSTPTSKRRAVSGPVFKVQVEDLGSSFGPSSSGSQAYGTLQTVIRTSARIRSRAASASRSEDPVWDSLNA